MIFLLIAFGTLLPQAQATTTLNACANFKQATSRGSASVKLKQFLEVQWKYYMSEYPEWATYVGYPGQNDRWTDHSLPAIERRKKEVRCALASMRKISRAQLSDGDKLNLDLQQREFSLSLEGEIFGSEYLPVSHMNGIQTESVDLFSAMPTTTAEDFKNILLRMELLPRVVEQVEILMREGMTRKLTSTRQFLPKVTSQIDALLTPKVQDSPFYRTFANMNTNFPKETQTELQAQAAQVITKQIYPAFKKLQEFLNKTYIPAARESIAWTDMPNGRAWYAHLVKVHTTTLKTPDQLHQVGLEEVARLTSEMTKIKEGLKFKGDLKLFNKHLLSDAQFYFTKPEDLIVAYRDITKKIDPELMKMFKHLPRLTYGVREVPAFRAGTSSGAEYQPGSLESGRAGWFQANTFDLKSRPKWAMETLAFHEGVPGHHFQIALAQEIENTPEFRKYTNNTAYVEGWALYAESLGKEMGFFKDPYSLYGHYSDEMLRAVRLVVDTGMHFKGWTRQQAMDYFLLQMPVTETEARIEIDRYITIPGQALAYKVGQLKFRELRERAHKKLGEKFDVRDYHDLVLGQGALPMDILEQVVDRWVSRNSSSL